jgi:hypothetical protein
MMLPRQKGEQMDALVSELASLIRTAMVGGWNQTLRLCLLVIAVGATCGLVVFLRK